MSGTEQTNPLSGRNEECTLDISQFITIPEIIPYNYYITSGEAVNKAEQLIKDLQEALKGAKNLYRYLTELRGDNKYLETELQDKTIVLKVKNPRSMALIPRRKRSDIPNDQDIIQKGDLLYRRDNKDCTSFCVINPDEETYAYFNWYPNSGKSITLEHKPIAADKKEFEDKLKKNGYNKVLL